MATNVRARHGHEASVPWISGELSFVLFFFLVRPQIPFATSQRFEIKILWLFPFDIIRFAIPC